MAIPAIAASAVTVAVALFGDASTTSDALNAPAHAVFTAGSAEEAGGCCLR
jgi:hypothetical protein